MTDTDLAVLFILLYIALVVVENAVKIWKWTRSRNEQRQHPGN